MFNQFQEKYIENPKQMIDVLFAIIVVVSLATKQWIFNVYLSFIICMPGGVMIAYLIIRNKQHLSKRYIAITAFLTLVVVGDNIIFLYNALNF